ncbi:hypothetical protein [Candidatus Formimonas warabiya]|uniref:Winged helix-turn-helix transcriptional regulator n=1 Tax=Formimonas warabiya TaxID=1761012 RepID=A0A3G1KWF7_FORW1|nr:hypothetical protein [Candidatus Formimonas warabiya]ATW26804.1 hypothetical protein DCMF_20345 [Candidatus Formimonas warabiya]
MASNNVKYHPENVNNQNLLKNTEINWWLSWPMIVVAFIVFWPVGAFLLLRRINIDKKTALISGKVITIIGWAGISLAVLGFFVSISQGIGKDDIGAITFLLVAGIVLLLVGKKTVKDAEMYKRYIDIVVNQEITSIDNIAATLNVSYESAREHLERMMKKGYFEGAFIDESAREIVLSKKQSQGHTEKGTGLADHMVVVLCKNCGANNTVAKGTIGECEYCGSHISVK